MAISLVCECGKKLSVKDELAGKRVKCPGCAATLLVAKSAPAPLALADDPQSEEKKTTKDKQRKKKKKSRLRDSSEPPMIVCTSCGWHREVSDRLEGTVVVCPDCGKKVNVQQDDDDDESYIGRVFGWFLWAFPACNGALFGIFLPLDSKGVADYWWVLLLVGTGLAVVISVIAAVLRKPSGERAF